MATLAALKKQIAALEAQVERVTKAEMGAAIAKVRKIMSAFGLTIEHLAESGSARPAGKKAAGSTKASGAKKSRGAAGAKKGSKPPKYRDLATGLTWTGVGRAPAWIANARNRDDFLIAKHAGSDKSGTAFVADKKAKRAAPAKRSKAVAKKAARKAGVAKTEAAGAGKSAVPMKRASSKKATAKVGATKKTAANLARKQPAAKKKAVPAVARGEASAGAPTA